MKLVKRILILLFAFSLFAFFGNFLVSAAAEPTDISEPYITADTNITVVGANIRTTGNSGLRFVGSVGEYDTTNVKAYGIALAYGEADFFTIGEVVNGKEVLSAVDESGIDEDGYFYVVLFNIPEDQYTQTVSARAFVVLKDNTYVYGTTTTKRSIYQVAKAAVEDPGYQANEYVTSIVEDAYLDLMLYSGADTSLHSAMVTEFLADFSAFKGGNPITDPNRFFNDTYKGDGSSLGYLFLTSDTYKAKWGWILNYINEVRTASGKSAIIASTGQADARGELHNFLNLNNSSTYGSDYSARNDYRYKLIVEDAKYTPNTSCAGYEFVGWYKDSAMKVSAGTEFTTSGSYYAKYNLINYTITYMNGGDEITSLNPSTYTYLTDDITLPNYELIGYRFEGWYDNPEFNGNAITTLVKHSSGNKVYYAKLTEISGYTVNYNFNGGNTKYANEDAMIDAFIAAVASFYGMTGVTRSNWSDKFEGTFGAAGWSIDGFFEANPEWNWFLTFVTALKADDKSGFEYGPTGTDNKYFWRMALRAYFTQEERASWPYVKNTSSFVLRSVDYLPYLSATEKTEYINNVGTISLLTNVYREGYSFGGWYDNEELQGEPITSVSSETTLYAKWIHVDHDYEDVVTDPTCTEQGYTTHTCKECGYSFVDTYVDPTGHTYSEDWSHDSRYHWHAATCEHEEEVSGKASHEYEDSVIDPSCTEKGYTLHTCKVCGYSFKDTYVDELGHSYNEDWSYDEDYHWHAATCEHEDEKSGYTTHNYQTSVILPSCTEQGYTHHVCVDCGYTYNSDYVAATGHQFYDTWTYDENYHWHASKCIHEDEVSGKELHDFEVVVTDPTCDSQGYATYTCKDCEYSYISDYQAATGHTFSEDWTYDEYYHWHESTCGHEDAIDSYELHNMKVKEVVSATCEHSGYTVYECEDCEYQYSDDFVPALAHTFSEDWSYDDTYHWHVATCGHKDEVGSYGTHNIKVKEVVSATCEHGGYIVYECEDCGYTYKGNQTPALAHTVSNWVETSRELKSGCTYTVTYTGTCSECGTKVTRTEEVVCHDLHTVIEVEATCMTKGIKKEYCSNEDCEYHNEAYSTTEFDPTPGVDYHHWVKDEEHSTADITVYYCDHVDEYGTQCSATKQTVNTTSSSVAVSKDILNDVNEIELKSNEKSVSIGVDDGIKENISSLAGNKDVSISAGVLTESEVNAAKEELSDEDKARLGNNPVYNFTINIDGDNVSDLCGTATVRIQYELGDKDPNNIIVWYVSEGKITPIKATYANGFVTFTTNHFSYYTPAEISPAEYCELYGEHGETIIVEPTCTEDGYVQCSRCGEILEVLPATGHDYSSEVTTEATCTTNGVRTYTCAHCGDTYTEVIPAIGHDYELVERVESSCAEHGHETYACKHCENGYTITLELEEHIFEDEIVEPGCVTIGYTLHTCKECGYSYKDNFVDSLGHNHIIIDPEEPTCTEDGHTSYIWCDRCEKCIEGYAVIPATGHHYTKIVTKPTCKEGGYTTFICDCGDSYIGEYTDKLDHVFSVVTVNPTCHSEGCITRTCNLCGEEEVEYLGYGEHVINYDNYVFIDDCHCHVCEECGEIIDIDPCHGGHATCESLAVCEVCGHEYGVLADHNYINGKCVDCGRDENDYLYEGYCLVDANENLKYYIYCYDDGTARIDGYFDKEYIGFINVKWYKYKNAVIVYEEGASLFFSISEDGYNLEAYVPEGNVLYSGTIYNKEYAYEAYLYDDFTLAIADEHCTDIGVWRYVGEDIVSFGSQLYYNTGYYKVVDGKLEEIEESLDLYKFHVVVTDDYGNEINNIVFDYSPNMEPIEVTYNEDYRIKTYYSYISDELHHINTYHCQPNEIRIISIEQRGSNFNVVTECTNYFYNSRLGEVYLGSDGEIRFRSGYLNASYTIENDVVIIDFEEENYAYHYGNYFVIDYSKKDYNDYYCLNAYVPSDEALYSCETIEYGHFAFYVFENEYLVVKEYHDCATFKCNLIEEDDSIKLDMSDEFWWHHCEKEKYEVIVEKGEMTRWTRGGSLVPTVTHIDLWFVDCIVVGSRVQEDLEFCVHYDDYYDKRIAYDQLTIISGSLNLNTVGTYEIVAEYDGYQFEFTIKVGNPRDIAYINYDGYFETAWLVENGTISTGVLMNLTYHYFDGSYIDVVVDPTMINQEDLAAVDERKVGDKFNVRLTCLDENGNPIVLNVILVDKAYLQDKEAVGYAIVYEDLTYIIGSNQYNYPMTMALLFHEPSNEVDYVLCTTINLDYLLEATEEDILNVEGEYTIEVTYAKLGFEEITDYVFFISIDPNNILTTVDIKDKYSGETQELICINLGEDISSVISNLVEQVNNGRYLLRLKYTYPDGRTVYDYLANISSTMFDYSLVDTNKEGLYEITFTFTDLFNLERETTILVFVGKTFDFVLENSIDSYNKVYFSNDGTFFTIFRGNKILGTWYSDDKNLMVIECNQDPYKGVTLLFNYNDNYLDSYWVDGDMLYDYYNHETNLNIRLYEDGIAMINCNYHTYATLYELNEEDEITRLVLPETFMKYLGSDVISQENGWNIFHYEEKSIYEAHCNFDTLNGGNYFLRFKRDFTVDAEVFDPYMGSYTTKFTWEDQGDRIVVNSDKGLLYFAYYGDMFLRPYIPNRDDLKYFGSFDFRGYMYEAYLYEDFTLVIADDCCSDMGTWEYVDDTMVLLNNPIYDNDEYYLINGNIIERVDEESRTYKYYVKLMDKDNNEISINELLFNEVNQQLITYPEDYNFELYYSYITTELKYLNGYEAYANESYLIQLEFNGEMNYLNLTSTNSYFSENYGVFVFDEENQKVYISNKDKEYSYMFFGGYYRIDLEEEGAQFFSTNGDMFAGRHYIEVFIPQTLVLYSREYSSASGDWHLFVVEGRYLVVKGSNVSYTFESDLIYEAENITIACPDYVWSLIGANLEDINNSGWVEGGRISDEVAFIATDFNYAFIVGEGSFDQLTFRAVYSDDSYDYISYYDLTVIDGFIDFNTPGYYYMHVEYSNYNFVFEIKVGYPEDIASMSFTGYIDIAWFVDGNEIMDNIDLSINYYYFNGTSEIIKVDTSMFYEEDLKAIYKGNVGDVFGARLKYNDEYGNPIQLRIELVDKSYLRTVNINFVSIPTSINYVIDAEEHAKTYCEICYQKPPYYQQKMLIVELDYEELNDFVGEDILNVEGSYNICVSFDKFGIDFNYNITFNSYYSSSIRYEITIYDNNKEQNAPFLSIDKYENIDEFINRLVSEYNEGFYQFYYWSYTVTGNRYNELVEKISKDMFDYSSVDTSVVGLQEMTFHYCDRNGIESNITIMLDVGNVFDSYRLFEPSYGLVFFSNNGTCYINLGDGYQLCPYEYLNDHLIKIEVYKDELRTRFVYNYDSDRVYNYNTYEEYKYYYSGNGFSVRLFGDGVALFRSNLIGNCSTLYQLIEEDGVTRIVLDEYFAALFESDVVSSDTGWFKNNIQKTIFFEGLGNVIVGENEELVIYRYELGPSELTNKGLYYTLTYENNGKTYNLLYTSVDEMNYSHYQSKGVLLYRFNEMGFEVNFYDDGIGIVNCYGMFISFEYSIVERNGEIKFILPHFIVNDFMSERNVLNTSNEWVGGFIDEIIRFNDTLFGDIEIRADYFIVKLFGFRGQYTKEGNVYILDFTGHFRDCGRVYYTLKENGEMVTYEFTNNELIARYQYDFNNYVEFYDNGLAKVCYSGYNFVVEYSTEEVEEGTRFIIHRYVTMRVMKRHCILTNDDEWIVCEDIIPEIINIYVTYDSCRFLINQFDKNKLEFYVVYDDDTQTRISYDDLVVLHSDLKEDIPGLYNIRASYNGYEFNFSIELGTEDEILNISFIGPSDNIWIVNEDGTINEIYDYYINYTTYDGVEHQVKADESYFDEEDLYAIRKGLIGEIYELRLRFNDSEVCLNILLADEEYFLNNLTSVDVTSNYLRYDLATSKLMLIDKDDAPYLSFHIEGYNATYGFGSSVHYVRPLTFDDIVYDRNADNFTNKVGEYYYELNDFGVYKHFVMITTFDSSLM